ncbi:MAG: sugar phosphate isomerase/epimerase [Spirochaetales bacterium]|nr:sugar phosphate isomerase/epimerase [Spirochaetales bacterium]
MTIPDTKIAVTLFNLREHCRSEDDLDSTLKRLKDMGYRAIQISAVALDPRAVMEKVEKYGFYVCASHESLEGLREDFDSVVEKLKIWNCDFTALGSAGSSFTTEPEEAGRLIAELDEYGRRFASEGIRFGYHNHHWEFSRAGESLFIERLYKETSRETFHAEIDVHWVQRGGQSPQEWIRKTAGRMPVCHFKDFKIAGNEPRFCEVGEGNLDWEAIIRACEETGVRWYSVEQDDPVEERDIFASMELSYNNLIKMGVK